MAAAGVERAAGDAAAAVDVGEGDEVDIGGDDHVEGSEELGILLFGDVGCQDVDLDAGIEFLNFGSCSLGALDVSVGN